MARLRSGAHIIGVGEVFIHQHVIELSFVLFNVFDVSDADANLAPSV